MPSAGTNFGGALIETQACQNRANCIAVTEKGLAGVCVAFSSPALSTSTEKIAQVVREY